MKPLLTQIKHVLGELHEVDLLRKNFERLRENRSRRPGSIKEFEQERGEKLRKKQLALLDRTRAVRQKVQRLRQALKKYSQKLALKKKLSNARIKTRVSNAIDKMKTNTRLLKQRARRELLKLHASRAGRKTS